MITSGRATGSSAWRRSRWKYCAEVVQFAMRMLSWAASWRKRSRRALECSGPLPSYPCGRSSVSREVCRHLASPLEMNWSTIVWAPLAKSPNCASQRRAPPALPSSSRTRSRRSCTPRAASCRPRTTPRALEALHRDLELAGAHVVKTRWRCENVPRSESWPVRRRGCRRRAATRTPAPRPAPSRCRPRRAQEPPLELACELRVDGEARRARASASRSGARSRSLATAVATGVDAATSPQRARSRAHRRDALAERRAEPVVRLVEPWSTPRRARASPPRVITPSSTGARRRARDRRVAS